MDGRILVVNRSDHAATQMRDALRMHALTADAVTSARACLGRLLVDSADVVVTDVYMPEMSGIELCSRLRDRHPDLLSIVLSGDRDVTTAIAALRAGAYDYITKPVNIEDIGFAVGRALTHLKDRKQKVGRLRSKEHNTAIDGIVGNTPAIRETLEVIRRVSDSDATVLISGESGTGKELVARTLHRFSPRYDQPFIGVSCAAMPAMLLESELFGHVRGAFTGASRPHKGLFVQAGDGTILLDEIGEMPLSMQVKILRVLQERSIRPVGGDEEVPLRARVVASTHRDLEYEVLGERFRRDLFFRLNVVGISVPALRHRPDDILLIAQHILDRIAKRVDKPVKAISAAAARSLLLYNWPGNVRELENCMERAVAMCGADEIMPSDLPLKIQTYFAAGFDLPAKIPELVTLNVMERRYVRQVLVATGGNKTLAANILGIGRRSLYRRLDT